ncbi:RICIN domain-containing protein [Streptomyces sp. NPDC001581]|uniref:RICIN domain-containing protein n=1 Tax=Streptomyces sp. NPDC001581 TaxID=3154386 RepID=UPI00331B5892
MPTVPSATSTTLVSAVSATKCADDNHGSTAEGNRIQIWDCNADPGTPQLFEIRENGEMRVVGKCVTAAGGGVANGTPAQLAACDGTGGQRWLPTAASGFYNPQSGRCLDLPSARIDNGTQLVLFDCTGSNAQRWHAFGLASPLGAAG